MMNDLSKLYANPVYEFMGQPVVTPYTIISRRIGFSADTLSLKRHTVGFLNHRWEIVLTVAPQNSGAIMAHMAANQFNSFEIIVPQPDSDPDFIASQRAGSILVTDPITAGDTVIRTDPGVLVGPAWSVVFPSTGEVVPIISSTGAQPFDSGFNAGFWGISIIPSYTELGLASPAPENVPAGEKLSLKAVASGIVSNYDPGASSIRVFSLAGTDNRPDLTGRLIRFSSHPKVYIVEKHSDDGTLDIFPPLMSSVSTSDTVTHWDVPMRVRYDDENMAFGMNFSDATISDQIKISLIEDI